MSSSLFLLGRSLSTRYLIQSSVLSAPSYSTAAAAPKKASGDKKKKDQKKGGKQEPVKISKGQRLNFVKHRMQPLIPDTIKYALPAKPERVHLVTQPEWAASLNALGLKYPVRPLDASLLTPSGFSPAVGPQSDVPFAVARSKFGNLPIYRTHRNGGTRVFTTVRHVVGDQEAFLQELTLVLSAAQPLEKPPVIERCISGVFQIQGDYMSHVLRWLKGLGF